MKISKIIISLLLLAAIAVNITSCAEIEIKNKTGDPTNETKPENKPLQADLDLMKNISAKTVSEKSSDEKFTASMADFSIELFKKSITDKENSLVSPLSVMLALAMTANGADNETLAQMEKVLGGDIKLAELNEYLYSYVKSLPSEEKSKLNIANSIWFRNDESLSVKNDFLQKNANYYGAEAYKSAFDDQTLKDINNWVKTNTDNMIDKILDTINDNAVLYLINAVVFDAEWQNVYNLNNILKSNFTDINGAVKNVDFMHSEEYKYLDDGKATGFIKPYANNKYSFAALLPNEDISIEEYIESLNGEDFINTLKNAESDAAVYVSMPKFKYDYEIKMNDALKALGMSEAFNSVNADFKKMATHVSKNIYIGEVLHKTFISVDELGTKAGAVTIVEMAMGRAAPSITVQLDRPFVYAIIDNATNLPVFIGTVMTVQ